jgi:Uma2 family endonuclease
LTAPLDVFFPGADPVQSDIIPLLPGWQGSLVRRGPQGAPDLVIEVVSPTNRAHDLVTKRALYAQGGVREYWVVDPATRALEVLTLDRGAFRATQITSEHATFGSPLLRQTDLPLARVFARIDEIAD